jgi:hypothetical protein
MISYRANLFESINKINAPRPGVVYEGIVNKDWPNPRHNDIGITEGEQYIFSHMRNGKMVLVRKMAGSWIFEVSPNEINKYFKPIGQANLQGYEIGDKIYSEMYGNGTITGFGLADIERIKAYIIREGIVEDEDDKWDFISGNGHDDPLLSRVEKGWKK